MTIIELVNRILEMDIKRTIQGDRPVRHMMATLKKGEKELKALYETKQSGYLKTRILSRLGKAFEYLGPTLVLTIFLLTIIESLI